MATISKESVETILVYTVLVFLFLAQIALYLSGLGTDWYGSLTISSSASLESGTIQWIITYLLSVGGFLLVRDSDGIGFLIGLTVLGMVLTVLWDVLFFYARDILLALIVQFAVTSIYALVVFAVWNKTRNVAATILQIPILLRSYYLFYQTVILFLDNSGETKIRPL